jgi:hypothetical protein
MKLIIQGEPVSIQQRGLAGRPAFCEDGRCASCGGTIERLHPGEAVLVRFDCRKPEAVYNSIQRDDE